MSISQIRDRMILEGVPYDQPLNDREQAALDREMERERYAEEHDRETEYNRSQFGPPR